MMPSTRSEIAVRRWAGLGVFIFVASGISLGVFLASISAG
jgi:hypothetical protein